MSNAQLLFIINDNSSLLGIINDTVTHKQTRYQISADGYRACLAVYQIYLEVCKQVNDMDKVENKNLEFIKPKKYVYKRQPTWHKLGLLDNKLVNLSKFDEIHNMT